MPLIRRRTTAALVTAAVLLSPAACSPATDTDSTAVDPDPDERVAAIRTLRSDVGPASVELGSAAATLVEQLDGLHADPPRDPAARREAAATIRGGSLAVLEDAVAAYGPELAGDVAGPDAEAVRAAMRDAEESASGLAEAADRDLEIIVRAAEADERLAAVVEAWAEPGSRNEQLARLDEAAAEADALAAELASVDDVPDCAGAIARRETAARAVADATRELRDLVQQRRGDEFDARRNELVNDPYGTGTAPVEEDATDVRCWREDGPVAARAGEVAEALAELESALNPPDLASPADG